MFSNKCLVDNKGGEIYTNTCKRCGKTFKTDMKKSYVCIPCKKKNKRELAANRYDDFKKPNKPKLKCDIPLFEMVHIIEEYNRQHQTHYTYGKFVLAVERGKIIIEKEKRKCKQLKPI